MSLQLAAQHMASRGRGPDTQLVHMAPEEVAGLQALAKAHGGSLTINPDTGLAEAGFLRSILPTLIGVGLSVASGGALTPLMAAGITGAGYGVATGSLQKGLMAGLGAYGGAGIAGGLMGAGAAGAGVGAAGAGASEMAATQAALQQNALTSAGIPSSAAAGTGSMSFAPGMSTNVLGAAPVGGPMSVPLASPIQAQQAVLSAAPQTVTKIAPTFTENLAQMGRGAQSLGTEAGRTALLNKDNLKYGLAGLAPMLFQEPGAMAAPEKRQPFEYDFSYNARPNPDEGYTGAFTGERTYFDPMFTRTAADGGMMNSGPLQAMSDRNEAETLMANGGQRFAEGGETKAVRPVEQDPYYTMSGQSGDAFKYLMGQMPAASRAPPNASGAVAQPAVQSTVQAPSSSKLSGFFGRALGAMGATSGGEYVDDPRNLIKSYSFDPDTGSFTSIAPPKIFRPYTPAPVDPFQGYAQGGIASLAQGGKSHLGDYSDGGRLLRGPGDGVSDDIPASIGDKQPARLADGEFVVPARIVSELGNGSTEAGARKLYAMMDRVQKARKKSIGKDRVAVNSRSEKLLPA